MATTLLEAAKRTQNRLMQGVALSIATTDELGAMIPFSTFQGQAMVYLREGTLPATEFRPDDGTMGTPSEGTFDQVTVPVRALASDMDVDALADDLTGGAQRGAHVAAKVKSTFRRVKSTIATGGNTTGHTLGSSADPFAAIGSIAYGPWLDSGRFGPGSIKYDDATTSWQFRAPGDPAFGEPVEAASNGTYVLKSHNPSKYIVVTLTVASATADGETHIRFTSNNEFDGLNRIIGHDMTVPSEGADGDALSFGVMDQLIDMVKVRNNLAFLMPSVLTRKFKAMQRDLPGTAPEHVRLPGLSGPTLAYAGIPILKDDNIPTTEVKGSSGATLSSVYLASLDAEEGLFLGVPGTGNQSIDVEGDPRRNAVMGFRIEELGLLEAKDHRRTRVKWYGALGLKSSLALARASEIQTA